MACGSRSLRHNFHLHMKTFSLRRVSQPRHTNSLAPIKIVFPQSMHVKPTHSDTWPLFNMVGEICIYRRERQTHLGEPRICATWGEGEGNQGYKRTGNQKVWVIPGRASGGRAAQPVSWPGPVCWPCTVWTLADASAFHHS